LILQTSGQAPVQPVDALLGAYAAGTLSPPLHVLVASHLEMSARNRSFVSALEHAGADAMMDAGNAPLRNRDQSLAAIFADARIGEVAATPRPVDPVLPQALRDYLGVSSDEIKWRFRLPGVKEHRVETSSGGEAVLYWIKAGRKMPSHTHGGQEVTLLLQGGFSDEHGHFKRGDIAVADDDVDHSPVADKGVDCLCFAVTDAPLKLTGPVMGLLRRVFGH
jgi:putative transcriptional regulator